MPLSILTRDADGKNQGFEPLLLEGEIVDADFSVSAELFGEVGLKHAWLHANFDQRILWVPEDQDLDDFKKELAVFLNDKIEGPYYVREGFVNTRSTLNITLLDHDDITVFSAQYPEWEVNLKAEEKNAATFKKWQEIKRPLQDMSLFKYAK